MCITIIINTLWFNIYIDKVVPFIPNTSIFLLMQHFTLAYNALCIYLSCEVYNEWVYGPSTWVHSSCLYAHGSCNTSTWFLIFEKYVTYVSSIMNTPTLMCQYEIMQTQTEIVASTLYESYKFLLATLFTYWYINWICHRFFWEKETRPWRRLCVTWMGK